MSSVGESLPVLSHGPRLAPKSKDLLGNVFRIAESASDKGISMIPMHESDARSMTKYNTISRKYFTCRSLNVPAALACPDVR